MAEAIALSDRPARQSWTERHLGWKAEAAAIALLALALSAVGGQLLLTQLTQPSAYAVEYLSALGAGDADTAWSIISVEQPATPVDASLLSEASLAAMLASPGNRQSITGVQAKTASSDGGAAKVDATYRQAGLSRRETLSLRLEGSERRYLLFPVWRVVVTPAILNVALPAGAGSVTIDGRPLPAGARSVAVFPGVHSVELSGSNLFLADREQVTAGATPTSAAFKVRLTDQAQSQAAAALKAEMGACAQATTLQPSGCPQGLVDNIVGGAQWQLYGDPAAGAAYAVDSDGHVVADGRYQMSVSYQGQSPAVVRHRAVAGAYRATFAWDGQQLKVQTLAASSAPLAEVPRPALDDATVLAQVKGAFDGCAAATVPDPAGCPQSMYTLGTLGNFHWHLDTDPTAGATLDYVGSQAMYRVSGSYAMSATYDETFPYQPTFHRNNQSTGNYTADVFWDGQKPVFVAFE